MSMANWLERARHEIPKSAKRSTANTDDRTLTAVTTVVQQVESGISGAANVPVTVTNEAPTVSALADCQSREADKMVAAWRDILGKELDRQRVVKHLEELRRWRGQWKFKKARQRE